jgi:hypothetical protein
MRQGTTYDANLTGLLFRFADKSNKYALNGRGALSQQYFSDSTELGHTYNHSFGKISGNFLFNLSHNVESDTYNPNDLGILFSNNSVEENLDLGYHFYQPFWKILNMHTNLGAVYARRYKPDAYQNFVVYGNMNATFKNFMSAGINVNLEPVKTYDFYEPRIEGWYYAFPVNYNIGGWVSSDYRKKFALDINFDYRWFDEHDRHNLNLAISPRFRVNDQLQFIYSFESGNNFDDMGYADSYNAGGDQKIIFGLRDVNTITNTLSGSYIFNNRMSLSLRARHYWSTAAYNRFFVLQQNGSLLPIAYSKNRDVNFNAFNVDMVYSWWFAPGSEVSVVWKNAILDQGNEVMPRYFENFSRTVAAPQLNTLSIKVLYYIDYLTLKKRLSPA